MEILAEQCFRMYNVMHLFVFLIDAGLRQLARLLVCNFRALEHGYGETDSILQTLRELPIIPLADKRVLALTAEGVFFPMEETRAKKKKAQAQKGNSLNLLKSTLTKPFSTSSVL